MKQVKSLATQYNIEVLFDEPMARHTSMGVGGPVEVLATAHDHDALRALVRYVAQSHTPVALLGGGTNIICADKPLPGIVLKLGRAFCELERHGDDELAAGAGCQLARLVEQAVRCELGGVECCWGIPGTVGGAIAGNAGMEQAGICSTLRKVEVLTWQAEPVTLSSEQFSFGYRWCSLAEHILTRAIVGLHRVDSEEQKNLLEMYRARRRNQPTGVRSAGCVFKNPPGDYAGRLIEQAGLKGTTVGDAMVSPIHANYIINRGHARAADVLELIRVIHKRVREEFGVSLELEVKIISAADDDTSLQ
jgi:UDP-N-acetylmuramate dehydrogenase